MNENYMAGYMAGYMTKEAAFDWTALKEQLKQGGVAAKDWFMARSPEEKAALLAGGGAIIGTGIGGAIGGWKGALTGGVMGAAPGGAYYAYNKWKHPVTPPPGAGGEKEEDEGGNEATKDANKQTK